MNKKIKAIGIGKRQEKNDFIMYVDCAKIVNLRSERKQSNEMIVSEVWPIT